MYEKFAFWGVTAPDRTELIPKIFRLVMLHHRAKFTKL